MNGSDGQHISAYDPPLAEQLVSEAADIVGSLGFAASHVVLIGGLVPGLLVPVLDPGVEPHVGTADIDLCLSIALVEGDTDSYERIETVLKRLGFTEGDASFRWHRRTGLPLTVEFFCPADEHRQAGRIFRPASALNPLAKHNFGGRLSALALAAGRLLTTDVELIVRETRLPGRKGNVQAALRVTGPLAFLAAKSLALAGPTARDKPKDAYDIVWLIESWPGGPAGAAKAFSSRTVFADVQVHDALRVIADAFADVDRAGARSYARFVASSVGDEPQLARRAVGAVAEFINALPDAPDR